MASNVASAGMRFYASGAELVQQTYAKLGESGKRMWADIATGQTTAVPAMRAVNAASLELQSGLQGVAANAGSAGRVLSTFGAGGVALAAGLGAAVLAAREVRKAMAFGDEIADTAGNIKVTTDTLQEYRFAMHAVGGEFQDADAGLKSFNERLGEARSGLSAKSIKPFEALGFTKDDLKRFQDAGDMLPLIADRIAKLGSSAEQAAVAKKLGLESLLPLLRQGAEGVERLRKEAHATGNVMDKDLVARLGNANDEIEKASSALNIQFKSALAGLTPIITMLMNSLSGLSYMIGAVADRLRSMENRSGSTLRKRDDFLKSRILELRNGGALNAEEIGIAETEGGISRDSLIRSHAAERWKIQEILRSREPKPGVVPSVNPTVLIDTDAGNRRRSDAEDAAKEKAEQDERFQSMLASIRDKALAAQISETSTIEDRLRIELARMDGASRAAAEEMKQRVASKELTQAQADTLLAEQARLEEIERAALQEKAANDKRESTARYVAGMASLELELLSIHEGMAVTIRERQDVQRQILKIEQDLARQALEERLRRDTNLTESERDAARGKLGEIQKGQNAALADSQSGLRRAIYDAWRGGVRDMLESGDVTQLFKGFFTGIADHFARKLEERLADALFDLTDQLLNSLVGGLSGMGSSAGGGLLGDLFGSIFGPGTFGGGPNADGSMSLISPMVGGFATGGSMQPGYSYKAAEHGTELAMIGRAGQVYSHEETGAMLRDLAGGNDGGGLVVNASFAPVYNVTGTSEELSALRSRMEEDRRNFEARTVRAVQDAYDRRNLVLSGAG